MFEIAALFARFFFIWYIAMFISGLIFSWNAVVKAAIILTHLTGFTLLAVSPGADIFGIVLSGSATLSAFLLSMYFMRRKAGEVFYIAIFLTDIGFICLTMLDFSLAQKQMIFFGLGMILVCLLPFILERIHFISELWPVYLGTGILLLAAVLIFGSEVYGARSWLSFGGFTFQPSEFVKILFVLFLASLLSGGLSLKRQLAACAGSAIFVFMLVMQKDLGAAVIFFVSFLLILYMAGGSGKLCLIAILSAIAAFYAGFRLFPDQFIHVSVRLEGWLEPFSHPDTSGYQLLMSLFAICTYGPFGIGLTRGMSAKIPFVEKDFIFATVCEDFGWLFGLGIIFLYLILFLKITGAARKISGFAGVASFGFASIIAVQSFVIIGGNTGLLPITGVTLPFISYGGSSLLSSLIMLGFIIWAGGRKEAETE